MKHIGNTIGCSMAICLLSVIACGNKVQTKASQELRHWYANVQVRKLASSIQSAQVQKVVVEFEEATIRELGEQVPMRKVSFTNREEIERLLHALRISSRSGGVEIFDGFTRPTDNVVIYLKGGGSRRFCMSTFLNDRISDRFGPEMERLYWKYRTLAFPGKKKH